MGRCLITMKVKDIAWLGGLLEGEGCFSLKKDKYPRISLAMTDEDVIVKAASLMKIKTMVYHHKNVWSFHIHGSYAIQWMMTLYPLLSKRRREKVASIIKFWRECIYGRTSNGIHTMATCHPNRTLVGFGMCNMCYQRYWKKRQLLKRAG